MNPWQHLKKTWHILCYYVDFLETCHRKNLLWSYVQDQSRIMQALAQSVRHLRPNQEKMEYLAQILEKVQRLKFREETLLLSSLQRTSELERRIAQLQKQLIQLADGQARLEKCLATSPAAGPALRSEASPEIDLLTDLYDILPHHTALDIGAHHGTVSARLLERGFRVHAFEPNPELHAVLTSRFRSHPSFQAHQIAVGEKDGEGLLHLLSNTQEGPFFHDPTLYSTLQFHPLPAGLEFNRTVAVAIRSLESLHQHKDIPQDVDLVKIDTEGLDALVLAGMGNRVYDVVMAEFWSATAVFGSKETKNHLHEMATLMKKRGYLWNIVLSCRDGEHVFYYLPDGEHSQEKSWGNVLFFQKAGHYQHALEWCRHHLPKHPSAATR